MTIADYEKILEALQVLKDNFYKDTEIYKQAAKLEDNVIVSQIPF